MNEKEVTFFHIKDKAWQALAVWGVFIIVAIAINGTIPFVLGADVRAWTFSVTKITLFSVIVYAGLFLVVPLILTKGLRTVLRPDFMIPVIVAVVGIALWWPVARLSALVVIPVLAYLHWRFDLSELGIGSRSWRGDVVAVLCLGILAMVPVLISADMKSFAPAAALLAAGNRLFANPASTVENMFYFGFLTERLSTKTGRWWTPLIIGAMYTLHEMSNPEYWYTQMNFVFVFVGTSVFAAVYLWRRSVVVIWLGDGLGRFLSNLF